MENLGNEGLLILSIDDPGISSVISKIKTKNIITYGFSDKADFRISEYSFSGDHSYMKVGNKNKVYEFVLSVPGKHNLLNALAAIVVGHFAGISWKKLKKFILGYQGSSRRYELISKVGNLRLYDDYAHHPNEIKTTISAFRLANPESQLIVIFQPHTYSRTKKLLKNFAEAFAECDLLFVADIFPSARENPDPSINSEILVSRINSLKNNSVYVRDFNELKKVLIKKIKNDALIVTMGAGDLNRWHKKIINIFKKNESSIR